MINQPSILLPIVKDDLSDQISAIQISQALYKNFFFKNLQFLKRSHEQKVEWSVIRLCIQ